ncbi:MarR family winged helix-turn-helix transcriptional regulator [Sporosalibacterium faouarense]|uniref:MarR family winged helix-turn-helix transcriptional regulator n=1 Tax=Sporosalibacterium faouarense TaxID=516123 RepID=UPI00141D4877|nr:MarR family transcriptional regulator [Sporosalibacterium faouarense]MTI47106.1 MarR family transcriptional regulator [Bacillota bacterium]
MKYEHLKIDNQLCFALYSASKAIVNTYKPLLKDIGITYTQYITLLVLWEKDNITVKELGKKLNLDSGTLTPLLKRLETKGILERIRNPEDERNVCVKLTSKGVSLKDKASEIPMKAFCTTGMSIDEASDLKERLNKLLKNLNEKS